MPHPQPGGVDSGFATACSQIQMLRKTPGFPASIPFELVESGLPGFPKHTHGMQHTAANSKH